MDTTAIRYLCDAVDALERALKASLALRERPHAQTALEQSGRAIGDLALAGMEPQPFTETKL